MKKMSWSTLVNSTIKKEMVFLVMQVCVLSVFWFVAISAYPLWFFERFDDVTTRAATAICIAIAIFYVQYFLFDFLKVAKPEQKNMKGVDVFVSTYSSVFIGSIYYLSFVWFLLITGIITINNFKEFVRTYAIVVGVVYLIACVINLFPAEAKISEQKNDDSTKEKETKD